MFSAIVNTQPLFLSNSNSNKSFSSSFLNPLPPFFISHLPSSKTSLNPISATIIPSSSSPSKQVYQPFRPPPSPLPAKFRSLDTAGRLDVLANRLGLWYEYAPLIPALVQEGFTPPTIEESTGISGVEQNRLVVGAKVRESLTDPEILSAFETGGAELLYEIRLLSVTQRAAAAKYIIDNKFDSKDAQDLARSVKDFPRRRGDKGWESFNYNLSGDCLSFMYYRQAREHKNPSEDRTNALKLALDVAESEKAKSLILTELKGGSESGEGQEGEAEAVKVPVVRLKIGEVAEASSVVVLPVCRADQKEKEILEAPLECKTQGAFGILVAEKGWERWVVLPSWEPIVGLKNGGVVVSFADARALPWRVNRWYKEEPILVVADRGRKEVKADDGFYLGVDSGGGGELKVERGSDLRGRGVEECLGAVLLVVRPPRDDTDDQLADEEWD
ncbi:rubisco accumulation factor 1.2, chloroplastic [Euphorbia lathyris]|uniref:rubisco accumulation factor 1.2, chloroplastic n=1 Tax=Euphorbia lathyris TaxID=212925 RepID=UPI00331314EA